MYYAPRPFTGYRVDVVPTRRDRRKGKIIFSIYMCVYVCVCVKINNNIITINHRCYLPTGRRRRRRLLITVVPNLDARTTVTVKTGVADDLNCCGRR